MVFDAHERAFAFFKGACARGVYDNMKTAVETIFIGKDRQYNRRFLQMCSHHLVEPVACTPASGWEKGQVENQVGLVRERFFTPRLRFKTFDELNAWLMDKCAITSGSILVLTGSPTLWTCPLIEARGRNNAVAALSLRCAATSTGASRNVAGARRQASRANRPNAFGFSARRRGNRSLRGVSGATWTIAIGRFLAPVCAENYIRT